MPPDELQDSSLPSEDDTGAQAPSSGMSPSTEMLMKLATGGTIPGLEAEQPTMTSEQKWATVLGSLLPMAVAAFGGKRDLGYAGGGVSAGLETGLKFGKESAPKSKSNLNTWAVKDAINAMQADEIRKENRKDKLADRADTRSYQEKQLELQRQANLEDRKSMASFQAGLARDNRQTPESERPASLALIDSLKKAISLDMENEPDEKAKAALQGIIDNLGTPGLTSGQYDDYARMADTFRMRGQARDKRLQTASPDHPDDLWIIPGAKNQREAMRNTKQRNDFTTFRQEFGPVISFAAELRDTFDPKKNPVDPWAMRNPITVRSEVSDAAQRAIATNAPQAVRLRTAKGIVQQTITPQQATGLLQTVSRRRQLLTRLIDKQKQLSGMGANFTKFEIDLVRGMLGVNFDPGTMTASNIFDMVKDREFTGSDPRYLVEQYMEDTTREAIGSFSGMAAGIDWGAVEAGLADPSKAGWIKRELAPFLATKAGEGYLADLRKSWRQSKK